MKKIFLSLVLFVAIFSLTTSCNTYKKHVTRAYYQKAGPETKLAIVPVQFHLKGPITNRFDDKKLIEIEAQEAYRFQLALENHIIQKMGTRRRKVSVNLQDVNQTNKLLKKSGYTVEESYQLTANELGEILGVDAVMLVDIESSQLLTNFESQAIKTGTYVLESIFGQNNHVNTGALPTGNTRANATIVDTKSDELLWANRNNHLTRVKYSASDAMANINHEFGRTFPFRNRDFKY